MSHESGASEAQATVNLVELFQEGDNCIERRRTDNLFRQLDERQLTEDEQSIIQQRVELQRKMFQEYERREKQRKVRELQEVCPDLDEEAATRALELCHWKEEDAAVRISSDPAFLRRVRSGVVDAAPAPEPVRRPRAATTTRAPVGPRPKRVDPNKVGAVFVGRFKSRLGPHQLSAMERQQRTAASTSAAGGSSGQGRRGGRAAKADTDAAAAKAAAMAEEEQEAQAAEEPEQQEQQLQAAEGVDADMADADAQVAPEGAEGEYETEEGDDAEAEPNSAGQPVWDLSDNEPQYEDDVMLPVMSPLPAARQQQQAQQEPDQQQGQAEQQQGEQAERVPGQSPRFQYRLVAETPNGGVHSVATTEWNAIRNGGADKAGGADGAQAVGPAGAAPTPVGGCAAPKAATGLAMAGAGAAEGEEVNSPRQHLQLSGPFTVTRSGAQQAASLQQTGAAAAAAAAAKALAACATSAPAPAKAEAAPVVEAAAPQEAKQEPPQVAAASDAAAAAPAGRGGRARRAAAATALLRASARRAARSGSADSDMEADPIESGSDSGAETGTDGSDFEAELETAVRSTGAAGRAGRAGVAAAVLAAAAADSSSDSDDDFVDDEASDDDFMESGGGRKRRGGGGRQPARKRGRAAAVAVVTAPAAAHAAAAQVPMVTSAAAPAAMSAPAAEAGTSGRDAAAAEAHDSEATETEDEGAAGGRGRGGAKGKKAGGRGGRGGSTKAGAVGAAGGGAISASGHTCRGRVKQKGVKRAELLAVGSLVPRQGWFNAGYIFPAGFKATTSFRSSVDLDALTVHTCEIIGEGGQYWPQPTYVVTAADRPDEPLVAKSCTGCWTAVLKRINAEIEGRRAAGEPLPPPPKTAIAGPEYFGLNQPDICAAIEALDPERQCAVYWDGKMDREAARGGQPAPARARPAAAAAGGEGGAAPAKAPRAPRNSTGGGGRGRRAGRRGSGAVEEEDEPEGANGDEDPEETYAGNRWSAVSRAERYRKRREEAGEDAAALLAEANATNPLPGFLDPITLEPVVNPAISPYGHVMGLATWKAVLAEQGRCPFTKKSLKAEALTVLTLNNIERYRSRIVNSI